MSVSENVRRRVKSDRAMLGIVEDVYICAVKKELHTSRALVPKQ